MPSVTLCVHYEPRNGEERVCVTGNIPDLGSWSHDGLRSMMREDYGSRWTLTVEGASAGTEIKYRYAVCSILYTVVSKITVHQWETNLAPRTLFVQDKAYTTEMQTFGEYGGKSSIQRGWLVDAREIRLMFEKPALAALAASLDCPCSIRITATDVTASYNTVPVFVKNLSPDDYTPRPQAELGESIEKMSDIVVFSTNMLPAGHDVKFAVKIFWSRGTSSEDNAAKRLKEENANAIEGSIMGNSLTNSVGSIPLYFFDRGGCPVGKVPVSYTVIEPLDDPLAHSLEVSYATHWNRERQRTLNIGHRGMGKSFKDHSLIKDIGEDEKLVSVPENTVYSLKEAADHGADFVEFDVHVTKDGCPVLFHDFQFSLCLPKSESTERMHLAKLSIKDMTLEQLSAVKRLIPGGAGTTDFLCSHRTSFSEEELPFSKLQMALETVPVHCGFDIEIKYPMMCEKSGSEYDGTPMDMNASLDAILKVVLKYGGARRIFFSAFNPDVCAMIRLKQSKYPIMLCNYDRTDLYESYTDPRNVTVERSIQSALADQILGLCGHCEDYLANPALVGECHRSGLVLACWGERTIEPEIRQRLTEIGLDGIIHDRMGTFSRGTKNNFLQNKKAETGSI